MVHPTWVLRKLRNRLRSEWLEWRTGVPGWIVEIGEISCCPHGYSLVSGWHINTLFRGWQGPLEAEEFVDLLVLAVPHSVVHEPLPDLCTFCDYADAELS